MSHSLRAAFDREFGEICSDLVSASQLVDAAIERSMQALLERDVELARQVIANDEKVNALRFKIEEACLVLIATQQPAAGDLRAVITAIHIVVEIERMGDHAAGIAKTVILMEDEPLLKTFKKIPRMGELSRKMLADCLQAFLRRDAAWARQIADQDEKMDELYRAVFDRLVGIMAKKPELVTRATYLMWCAHNLERIADRVTNIAERIIFMMTGTMQELNV
ncbi:MAG: phosphate signaling complex protein PhoU [Chloroflexota bacterium]